MLSFIVVIIAVVSMCLIDAHYSDRFTPSYISFDAAILHISVTIDSNSSKANTHGYGVIMGVLNIDHYPS